MKKITASQLDNLSCLFTYQPTSTKFFCIPYKTKDWNVRTVDQTENSIKHHKPISFFQTYMQRSNHSLQGKNIWLK